MAGLRGRLIRGVIADLVGELVDLKRVTSPAGPFAERRFLGAWAALVAGDDPREVALREAAAGLAACRLGAIDATVLRQAGLDDDAIAAVGARALDEVGAPDGFVATLAPPRDGSEAPAFAHALARQPRAGATRPGHARLMLAPAETHADHCWVVAVAAVVVAEGDPTLPFLAGLAHHAHNAALPDAGFTGEMLLGEHLDAVLSTLREQALDELPGGLRSAGGDRPRRHRRRLDPGGPRLPHGRRPRPRARDALARAHGGLHARRGARRPRPRPRGPAAGVRPAGRGGRGSAMTVTEAELVVGGIPVHGHHPRALAASSEEEALAELLIERDSWAPGEPPTLADARAAIAAPTLREAMEHLRYGPVADYFAYRLSDPTYLSGLALLQTWPQRPVFELGCGIGLLLREAGPDATGADVVFSKLWLAQRFVVPGARLVCFDAADPFPFADDEFGAALCHDALYFLPDKAHAVDELARVAPTVLIGHTHNRDVDTHGDPLTPAEYAALLPGATLYDDAELTAAYLEQRLPVPTERPLHRRRHRSDQNSCDSGDSPHSRTCSEHCGPESPSTGGRAGGVAEREVPGRVRGAERAPDRGG